MRRLHRERWRFRPLRFLAEHMALRTTRAAAARHLGDSLPQLAVYSFDYIGIQINQDGVFERDELFVLFRFLAPLEDRFRQSVAIDIGANIGNHTVWLAPRFKALHAFEPNPIAARLLEINAELCPNVTVHKLGLGAARDTRDLLFSRKNFGDGTAAPRGGAEPSASEKVTIELDRLDAVLPPELDVSFIKIDVEGMEAEALAGAEGVISTHRPVIVFEQRASDFEAGTTPAVELLKALGYRLCQVQRRHWGGNTLARAANLVRQTMLGVEYAVIESAEMAPGYHPLIVAVPSEAMGSLGPDAR